MVIIHFQLFWRLNGQKRFINDKWISVEGKHSIRLQNVDVYVWTGPKNTLYYDAFVFIGKLSGC